jgi:hypothetical protein
VQLVTTAALPARGAVPAVDFRTVRHRGSMPDKRALVRTRSRNFLRAPG